MPHPWNGCSALLARPGIEIQIHHNALLLLVRAVDQNSVAFGAPRVAVLAGNQAGGHVADVHIAQAGLLCDLATALQCLAACGRDVLWTQGGKRMRHLSQFN